jgi:hypothetical protein
MTGASNVNVERLTLHAGSMSESDARRLAELVALAFGRLPEPPKSIDAAKLSIDVPAQPGRGVPEIADAVAAAIAAALKIDAVS